MREKQRGLLVTFEGFECAGKTTCIERMETVLRSEGYPVIRVREPGSTEVGEKIRHMVLHATDMSPATETLLFNAARVEHVTQVIAPALANQYIVLCDRFRDSTYAYQGALFDEADGSLPQVLDTLLSHITGEPDAVLLFDIDYETFEQRVALRGDKDKIESRDKAYGQRVIENFRDRVTSRTTVLDARQDPERVFNDAYDAIKHAIRSHYV